MSISMKAEIKNIEQLEAENAELRAKLRDATAIVDSIRDGSVDALVVKDSDGNPKVFAIESADYTYRILIEKFTEGALSITEKGLILYANSYFGSLMEKPGGIPGMHIRDFLATPGDWETIQENIRSGILRMEILLKAESRTIPVEMSFTDLHPTVPAIGVVVIDLTEKKMREESLLDYQGQLTSKIHELHTTNTDLEQVIHVISHDLKEPLRKILTYTNQLQEYSQTVFSETDQKWISIVNKSAVRLNSLLDDVVKYAFTGQRVKDQVVNLNVVIDEVLEDLEISIGESNFKVTAPELPKLLASDVQLRQLFANLFSNAIKYRREEDPAITISSSRTFLDEIPYICVTLSDNGIGMRTEDLRQIFTVFKRLHNRDEYSGNGIGLAICKKIMDNHGGRIEVSSEVGVGTKFNLYFPADLIV
ncbi:MAG: PAS domain-containing sensor histidine kinase [Flavobacterium sp.]|nr:MAG: PAS domain-containing sensor histidine kinase [Flavobacterium sp.]